MTSSVSGLTSGHDTWAQPRSLKDWLKIQGNKVIICPQGIDSSDVTKTVLERLGKRKIYLLSDNEPEYEETKKITLLSIEKHHENLEKDRLLIVESKVPYYPEYLDYQMEVLFILPYGFNLRTINGIKNLFHPIGSAIFKEGYAIKIKGVEVQMSDYQKEIYKIRRKKEKKEKTYEASINLRSFQAANFAYPEKMQKELNKPRQFRKEVKEDILKENGGWITEKTWDNIDEYSTKMERIVSMTSEKEKTVIYTRFKEHYGAYLIQSLFSIFEIEAVVLTGEMRVGAKKEICETFNREKRGILITTIIPLLPLKRVNTIFITEGAKPDLISSLLRICGGKKKQDLFLMISMLTKNTGTVDRPAYRLFMDSYGEILEAFAVAYSSSKTIIENEEGEYDVV